MLKLLHDELLLVVIGVTTPVSGVMILLTTGVGARSVGPGIIFFTQDSHPPTMEKSVIWQGGRFVYLEVHSNQLQIPLWLINRAPPNVRFSEIRVLFSALLRETNGFHKPLTRTKVYLPTHLLYKLTIHVLGTSR